MEGNNVSHNILQQQSEGSKKSSPYLKSLNEVQLKKRVQSPSTFHYLSISSKLFGKNSSAALLFDEDKGKDKKKTKPKPKLERTATPSKSLKPKPKNLTKGSELQKKSVKVTVQTLLAPKTVERSISSEEIRKPAVKTQQVLRPSTTKEGPTESSRNLANHEPETAIKDAQTTGDSETVTERQVASFEDKNTGSLQASTLKSILKVQVGKSAKKKTKSKGTNIISKKNSKSPRNKPNGDENSDVTSIGGVKTEFKKVTFFDTVRVIPVPYESRGSTEWQKNLMLNRESIMSSLFNSLPRWGQFNENFLFNNSNWSGLSKWGFGNQPTNPNSNPRRSK